MSAPYDQYGQGQGYGSQYPGGGYAQQPGYPASGYAQPGYDQHQQQYPPQGYGAQDFGPPRRADSFGPPQAGGFQHGQAGQQYGAYDASNPQGNADYYGNSGGYPQPGHDAYLANQHYQQHQPPTGTGSPGQLGPTSPDPAAVAAYQNHDFAPQSSDPNAPNYDPTAPPMSETDRGLMGAIGGAWGGHHFGKKQGHGLIGMLAGAVGGSMLEDFAKKKKHQHHSGGGSQYSQSSWGGGKW